MSTDNFGAKGEIILENKRKYHGNSEEDIEKKLSVKDNNTLILEECREYYDAYKSKTKRDISLYEIKIQDIIGFIKKNGNKLNDQT